MKQRLLTAGIGIPVAVAWLCSLYTPVFSAVLAVVAVIAQYEMLKVFGVKNKPFKILTMALAAGIVLIGDYKNNAYVAGIKTDIPIFPVITAIVLISMILMVLDFKGLEFSQVASSLFCAILTSAAFACVLYLRDAYITWPDKFIKTDGIFFIIFAFLCSWMSDGCAYFAGRAFGKHKLAPEISPKKTVEGAIGGVIGNEIFCVALYFIMLKTCGLSDAISLPFVLISAPVLSVISIFGDLAASTIKRHHGVKDFGNLLPGHGGVMDRFDSSVFVFAAIYAIVFAVAAF